jgi:ATP-dependent DNA helicase RecQ
MTLAHYDLESALHRFGLQSFRPGQREVIASIVDGDECLCVMPTGGGKSLCYQLPSVIRPGLTIVVSPLIALMKDQVDSLCQRGIPAALINSTLSAGEQNDRLQEVAAGKYQLVYVAPERLRNNRFLDAIRATPIQLLAIDEAHCISQWGHDFRPDYAKLGRFREWLGGVQTIALTATATPRVRDDIVQVLGLKRPKQFMSGFARPNLHFGVVQRQNDREKDEELEEFLRTQKGSGIIYAATRKRCEALVEWITQKLKINVGAYHAGLMPDQRRAIQERFMQNQLRVIVATNAFGMGIDKPDLRFVIHYNTPGSLEAYYQEAGRAGRDGADSQCVLLYSYQDRYIQEFFIENNYPAREVIQATYEFLQKREEDPIELTHEEIRDALGLSISPEAIGSSLQVLARTGVLDRLETGAGLAAVRIDSEMPSLVDLLPKEAKVRRKVLRVVERAVGDRRGEVVYIHPRFLLQQTEMERDALARTLRELCKLEAFDYVPPFRGRAVHFIKRDVPFNELHIDFENIRKRKEAEYDRLNQVVRYAQSPLCRQATILQYFGDAQAENCGQCDRCCGHPGWPKFVVKIHPPVRAEPSKYANEENEETAPLPQKHADPNSPSQGNLIQPPQQSAFLLQVIDSIERIHGRLGKILIAQYLSGSQNAKIQKLRLHRMSGFGMLEGSTQADVVALLDLLLAGGLLRQQEVNRNRPTVSVSPELADMDQRRALVARIQMPVKLQSKFAAKILKAGPSVAPDPAPQPTSDGPATASPASLPQAATALPQALAPEATGSRTASLSTATKSALTTSIPKRDLFSDQPSEANAAPSPTQHFTAFTEESSSAASPPAPLPSPHGTASNTTDCSWTLKLFNHGYNWIEVMEIRRMSDIELAASLISALQQGESLQRHWLSPAGTESERSLGQQRVHRELQRRAAAGVQR